jgi:hypothetical protein
MELGQGKPGEMDKHVSTPPPPPQTLLTKLCGQDRLLRQLQEDLDKRQEEKVQKG